MMHAINFAPPKYGIAPQNDVQFYLSTSRGQQRKTFNHTFTLTHIPSLQDFTENNYLCTYLLHENNK